MGLKKYVLLSVPIYILYISSVFSQSYVYPSSNIITSDTECYLIKNSSMTFQCDPNTVPYLNTPCYYDAILESVNNTGFICNFNRILVYNSTDIYIKGYGTVVIWNSTLVSCEAFNVVNETVTNETGYLLCLPPNVNINVTLLYPGNVTGIVPLGALGILDMSVQATDNVENLYITIRPTCVADIVLYNSSKPVGFTENTIYIDAMSSGNVINMRFYYRPIYGETCSFTITATVGGKDVYFSSDRVYLTGNVEGTKKVSLSDITIFDLLWRIFSWLFR